MKKILALILALFMSVGVLAACGEKKDQQDTATTTAQQGEVTDPITQTESPYDSEGYLKDDLDPNLSFGDKTINILYWSDVERPEFEVEEVTGDLVNDALFNRNMTVENRMGIQFNWIGTNGNFGNQAAFVSAIANDISAGGEYNVFAGYSLTGATIASRGYSRDLKVLDHINFDQPWWPSSLLDQATIGNKLYFCSGDISTNMLHMMYCVIFNKTLAEQTGIHNLYDLVRSGEWTLDKLIEISEPLYSDLNGDGQINTSTDQFGFMTSDLHFDAFFTGCGLQSLAKDENDYLIISESFGSSKTQDLLVKLTAFLASECADGTGTASTNPDVGALSQGRTLFNLNRCYATSWEIMKDVSEYQYGILPVPKWDAEQENYVTCMAFPYTLYSISSALDEDTANMTAAVLECMASEGYRQVSPALFETTMKLKYASGQDDSDMYDLIRSTIYVDTGRIFGSDLGNITYNVFRTAVKTGSTNWASIFKGNSAPLKAQLKKVTEAFAGRAE